MRDLVLLLLQETLSDYEKLFLKPCPIGLKLITKDRMIYDASNNFIYKMLIDTGVFKDFANEYPVFAVVYSYDKHPFNIPLTGKCWIGFCEEIAINHLKDLTPYELQTYIEYALAHEITHIMEDEIRIKRPDLYSIASSKCLNEGENREALISEALAEDLAHTLVDVEELKPIVDKIWGGIFKKVREMT